MANLPYREGGWTDAEIYEHVDGGRHFNNLTTVNDHHVRRALDALREEVPDGTFTNLIEKIRTSDTEDVAKLLGVSFEMARVVQQVVEESN